MNEPAALERGALAGAIGCALLSLVAVSTGLLVGPERALGSHLIEETVVALVWATLAAVLAVRRRPTGLALAVAAAWSIAAASNGWALLDAPGAAAAGVLGAASWAVGVGLAYTVAVLRASQRPVAPALSWRVSRAPH